MKEINGQGEDESEPLTKDANGFVGVDYQFAIG